MRQLVAAAEAMEKGRWEAPIDLGGRDELGVLASRFDQMRKRQRVYVERLEEVARAKSEFIAVASHELRTPIAIIKGWRDLLGDGRDSAPTIRASRRASRRSGTRARRSSASPWTPPAWPTARRLRRTPIGAGPIFAPRWRPRSPMRSMRAGAARSRWS